MGEILLSNSIPPGGEKGDVLTKTGGQNYEVGWKAPEVNSNSGGSTSSAFPSGVIVIWSGSSSRVPEGWALCDGTKGTPDLRGRFVLGAGSTYAVGETGGEEEVTLTVRQMPKHDHYLAQANPSETAVSFSNYQKLSSASIQYYASPPDFGFDLDAGLPNYYPDVTYMDDTGWSEPHPNMPPYYALAYIMKL